MLCVCVCVCVSALWFFWICLLSAVIITGAICRVLGEPIHVAGEIMEGSLLGSWPSSSTGCRFLGFALLLLHLVDRGRADTPFSQKFAVSLPLQYIELWKGDKKRIFFHPPGLSFTSALTPVQPLHILLLVLAYKIWEFFIPVASLK